MRIPRLIPQAAAAWRLLPLAAGLTLSLAAPAPAQSGSVDPRWLPWLGCWSRVTADDEQPSVGASRLACVVPAEGASAVEIVTVIDGAVITRERVDGSVDQRAVDQDGCTGTERVRWAADGRRVFRTAELDCQGGLHQAVSQLFAIGPGGAWLDIQGVTVHDQTGLRVLRYREADPGRSVPGEIASRLTEVAYAASLARTASTLPVAVPDVVEASGQVPATVVQAWLLEQDQGFALSGRQLVELSAQGVPGGIIDVMVALSYPKAFQVNRVTQTAERAREPNGLTPASPYVVSSAPYASTSCDPYIDSFSLYSSARCGYYSGGMYGVGSYWGFGAPHWGGWHWGRQPIIVVSGGSAGGGTGSASHGRVVNGSGYRAGPGDPSTSRQGLPRDNTPPAGSSGGSSSGSVSASQSGSGGARTSGGGSSTAPSSGERTAKPRP